MEWKGEDKSIGWSTKEQLLLLCLAKGATAGSCPQDRMIHTGGGREFYTIQGAGVNSSQTSLGLVSSKPSHPPSSPSPPAPNPSQHQSLFQWVNSSHEVAKVLEFQLQHQSFQRNPRADLLQNGLVGSPCSPRDSQESSPTLGFKKTLNNHV